MRTDGRKLAQLRPIKITPSYIKTADGSVLIEMGDTKVICTAKLEDRVPPFLRNSGKGWITAEYGMLPGSSSIRIGRESSRGKVGGRTHEIQRLIGRSLRAIADLRTLGEKTIWIDCDVIQADGGTRTASITGAYVALAEAVRSWLGRGMISIDPVKDAVAAVSIGIVEGKILLDLCYEEDSKADVDMNFVMTGAGKFIEVQGTAEAAPFTRRQMERMAEIAQTGIKELLKTQKNVIGSLTVPVGRS
ncbi:MAG TPA: ribonuclease PH [Candidatus Eisenbacteria bacterium]|jgi:ribonuclease PH|nr:ribonuclease PH [Candidatus Eisenbacteria bacterium]